jgi:hypothetical protein
MTKGLKAYIDIMSAKLKAAIIIGDALDKARAELKAAGMDAEESADAINEIIEADAE